MKSRMLATISLAGGMLCGSLGAIATGSVASAADDARTAPRFAEKAGAALAKRKGATAVRFAEQAVALAPRDAVYRALLGRAYLAAGRFGSAAQALTDTLALDPADGRSALNLALAQIATGDWFAARGTLTAHAERIVPADHGLALALAGDPSGGMAMLAEAARDPAATATVRQNLALVLALNGRWVEARAVAAVDVAPDQVDRRLGEWAEFARPGTAAQQVAALLGVTPVADRGQPLQLALAPEPSTPVAAVAWKEAMPAAPSSLALVAPPGTVPPAPSSAAVTGPTGIGPVLVEPSASPAIATGVHFAPYRAIVQALPAVPVRLAAPRAAPAPPVTGSYFVQLGAYPDVASARDGWHRVRRGNARLTNLSPQGVQATVRGVRYYRLSVGGFTRNEALQLCRDLRNRSTRCFVRNHVGERLASWARPIRMASR